MKRVPRAPRGASLPSRCPLCVKSGHCCFFNQVPIANFVAGVICSTDRLTPLIHISKHQADEPLLGDGRCECPVLSYFLVAGTVLFGVLVLVSNKFEPKPLPVSQMVGVPAPFKAPPEDVQSRTGAVNIDRQNL